MIEPMHRPTEKQFAHRFVLRPFSWRALVVGLTVLACYAWFHKDAIFYTLAAWWNTWILGLILARRGKRAFFLGVFIGGIAYLFGPAIVVYFIVYYVFVLFHLPLGELMFVFGPFYAPERMDAYLRAVAATQCVFFCLFSYLGGRLAGRRYLVRRGRNEI